MREEQPVHESMYLYPPEWARDPAGWKAALRHSAVVGHYSISLRRHDGSLTPDSATVMTCRDGVHLVIPEAYVHALIDTMDGAPVSYRVRWEPFSERAYPWVWQEMADARQIVYDRLIIGERQVLPTDANRREE